MPRPTKKMKLESVINMYDESSDDDDFKKGRVQKRRQELESAMQQKEKKAPIDPEEEERKRIEKKKEQDKKKRQKKILRVKRKRESQLSQNKPSVQDAEQQKQQQHKKELSDVYKRQNYTVSIALPGCVLKREYSEQLRAFLTMQLARVATMFKVDEVVVFNEEAKPLDMKNFIPNVPAPAPTQHRDTPQQSEEQQYHDDEGYYDDHQYNQEESSEQQQRPQPKKKIVSDNNIFLANLLYYLETPPYLRAKLFPHIALFSEEMQQFELPALEGSHHLLPLEFPHAYRDGVTVDNGDTAYIGREKMVKLDQAIPAGLRVTIETYSEDKQFYKGRVVRSSEPKEQQGIYWGYNVRVASSLSEVFTSCGYSGGYDLTVALGDESIGKNVDDADFKIPSFKHLLIVFGGPEGLEKSIESDKKIAYGTDLNSMFDLLINPVPQRGVRNLQPLEALTVGLSSLRPYIDYNVVPLTDGSNQQQVRKFAFIKE